MVSGMKMLLKNLKDAMTIIKTFHTFGSMLEINLKRSIWRSEGPRGFMKGVLPPTIGKSIYNLSPKSARFKRC